MTRGKPVCCEDMRNDSEGREPVVNVVSNVRPKRPSKLLDAMRRRAHGGATGHLGFGSVPAESTRRPALVASLSMVDKAVMEAIGQAGADGIEVVVRGEADLAALRSVVSALPVPVGILLDSAAGWVQASAADEPDIDWVRLSLQASAVALTWEKVARFITIPEDLELRRIPALNVLEVDAVVIDGAWAQNGGLSIEDALRLAALGEICKKPIFLNAGPGLSPELVSVAKQCGIHGLLQQVELDTAAATVAAYIEALEASASRG